MAQFASTVFPAAANGFLVGRRIEKGRRGVKGKSRTPRDDACNFNKL